MTQEEQTNKDFPGLAIVMKRSGESIGAIQDLSFHVGSGKTVRTTRIVFDRRRGVADLKDVMSNPFDIEISCNGSVLAVMKDLVLLPGNECVFRADDFLILDEAVLKW